jgi:ferritin
MGNYREYENKSERSINGIANSIIAKRDNSDYNFISFLLVEGDNDSKLAVILLSNSTLCRSPTMGEHE